MVISLTSVGCPGWNVSVLGGNSYIGIGPDGGFDVDAQDRALEATAKEARGLVDRGANVLFALMVDHPGVFRRQDNFFDPNHVVFQNPRNKNGFKNRSKLYLSDLHPEIRRHFSVVEKYGISPSQVRLFTEDTLRRDVERFAQSPYARNAFTGVDGLCVGVQGATCAVNFDKPKANCSAVFAAAIRKLEQHCTAGDMRTFWVSTSPTVTENWRDNRVNSEFIQNGTALSFGIFDVASTITETIFTGEPREKTRRVRDESGQATRERFFDPGFRTHVYRPSYDTHSPVTRYSQSHPSFPGLPSDQPDTCEVAFALPDELSAQIQPDARLGVLPQIKGRFISQVNRDEFVPPFVMAGI